MRTRLVFLYVDSKFDVQKCKYVWESSIVADTKIICGYNFIAPLKKLQFPITYLKLKKVNAIIFGKQLLMLLV